MTVCSDMQMGAWGGGGGGGDKDEFFLFRW